VGTYGLSIDEENGRLYIGMLANGVMVYDTADLDQAHFPAVTAVDNIPTSSYHPAVDVAIDVDNQYLYATAGSPDGADTYLHKYELNNGNAHSSVDLADSATIGVAVDQATGLVYCTCYGSKIFVVDSNLAIQNSYEVGRPTGLVVPVGSVGYNPLNLTITAPSVVGQGADINYSYSYENPKMAPPMSPARPGACMTLSQGPSRGL